MKATVSVSRTDVFTFNVTPQQNAELAAMAEDQLREWITRHFYTRQFISLDDGTERELSAYGIEWSDTPECDLDIKEFANPDNHDQVQEQYLGATIRATWADGSWSADVGDGEWGASHCQTSAEAIEQCKRWVGNTEYNLSHGL